MRTHPPRARSHTAAHPFQAPPCSQYTSHERARAKAKGFRCVDAGKTTVPVVDLLSDDLHIDEADGQEYVDVDADAVDGERVADAADEAGDAAAEGATS